MKSISKYLVLVAIPVFAQSDQTVFLDRWTAHGDSHAIVASGIVRVDGISGRMPYYCTGSGRERVLVHFADAGLRAMEAETMMVHIGWRDLLAKDAHRLSVTLSVDSRDREFLFEFGPLRDDVRAAVRYCFVRPEGG